MTIAIDFDGTLHMGVYPEIGIPMPYAIEMMCKLRESGHYLITNTCRSGDYLVEAVNWMLEKGIPFDRINDNHPSGVVLHKSNSRKVFADVYVDDRQVGGLPMWPDIYKYIASLRKSTHSCTTDHITFPYAFDYLEQQAKQADMERKEVLDE